jgi:hypothetical protein
MYALARAIGEISTAQTSPLVVRAARGYLNHVSRDKSSRAGRDLSPRAALTCIR